MEHKQIVWLASYPKSGNTWVRTFLDAYFIGDVDLNEIVCSVTDDRADRHQIGDGSNIIDMPIDIQHLARPMSLLRLVRIFNENKYADVPLFVKTHTPNMIANGVELLPSQLTKATIFLVRDPRDVAVSFAKHMGTDIDTAIQWMDEKLKTLKATGSRTMDLISSWGEHTKSYLLDDCHNTLVIKYEDLRENPVDQFVKILKHSGVEPDIERVKQAVEKVDINRLKQKEQEGGFKESSPFAKNQFFGKGEVGGWTNKLTPLQSRRIEKLFNSMMRKMGYTDRKVA